MKRIITTLFVALTVTVAAAAPASACGPYGDPTVFAQWDVEYWQGELDRVRGELAAAVEANDPEAVTEQMARLGSTVDALVTAEQTLATLRAEQAEREALLDAQMAAALPAL